MHQAMPGFWHFSEEELTSSQYRGLPPGNIDMKILLMNSVKQRSYSSGLWAESSPQMGLICLVQCEKSNNLVSFSFFLIWEILLKKRVRLPAKNWQNGDLAILAWYSISPQSATALSAVAFRWEMCSLVCQRPHHSLLSLYLVNLIYVTWFRCLAGKQLECSVYCTVFMANLFLT